MAFKDDIKFNCDVSDAGYWGFFSICGLLLRYRELYRSEKGLKAWSNIDRKDIASWIDEKESRWPELEQQQFRDLNVEGRTFQPFDVDAINRALRPQGLVYGAGYGMYMKPTFFLAELKETKELSGVTVHTSGLEHARDLFTAPAMLQGSTVFLRLEPLLIMLHFKFSELNAGRNQLLEDALALYGFQRRAIMDSTLEQRLEGLAIRYADIVLYHELAEFTEAAPLWKEILGAAGDRTNEHYLRAIKDLIADTSDRGPLKNIIAAGDEAALALSIALMEGFRKALFPELREAYAEFRNTGKWNTIEQARKQGHERFTSERGRVVEAFKNSGGKEEFAKQVKKSIPV